MVSKVKGADFVLFTPKAKSENILSVSSGLENMVEVSEIYCCHYNL